VSLFHSYCCCRSPTIPRIRGCDPDVDVWQRILHVRSLVLKPEDDSHMWIKFANLCRKNGRMNLAEKTINSLLPIHVSQVGFV
jgi:FKBP12-rapamycin complex-associated protein